MLSLSFSNNRSGHQDLILSLGRHEWSADSYYLAVDAGVQEKEGSAEKVRKVLGLLLTQWRTAIENLSTDQTCYLPYDFSDQCTAWIRCTQSQSEIVLEHGWSNIEGWSFEPSDIAAHLFSVTDFQPTAGIAVKVQKQTLLSHLDQVIANV